MTGCLYGPRVTRLRWGHDITPSQKRRGPGRPVIVNATKIVEVRDRFPRILRTGFRLPADEIFPAGIRAAVTDNVIHDKRDRIMSWIWNDDLEHGCRNFSLKGSAVRVYQMIGTATIAKRHFEGTLVHGLSFPRASRIDNHD